MKDKILRYEKIYLISIFAGILLFLGLFCVMRGRLRFSQHPMGTYSTLQPCDITEDPLEYIGEDFTVMDGFHTNLPIVILSLDTDLPDYKTFKDSSEVVFEGVDPYTTGHISIIDTGLGDNTLADPVIYDSMIKIKIRGHSSYNYDKKQYKIKAYHENGNENQTGILGMGEGSEWIINGSLADKSMMRNYLAYRIASEIDGNNMAPDSRYCEVLIRKDDNLKYQGVFLIMESVSRGKDRVKIDKYNPKKKYSSYIVRRDRKTNFDIMLDTYGRQTGIVFTDDIEDTVKENDNWIGLKYPGKTNITDETIEYITKDFSKTEKVLYSKNINLFRTYEKYINVESFVDYFLINEFFGNYDAGEHSTYMHKNSGDVLYMGPVWDFDQAMNNYLVEELKAEDLAFEMQPFFKELCNDKKFVRKLQKRYAELRKRYLSEDYVFNLIEETENYLKCAQVREWYRWAADYLDDTGLNPHNYNLNDIVVAGVTLSRFTDEYSDEIYVIKKYIHEHGNMIQRDLTGILNGAKWDTTIGGIRELIFIAMITLVLLPSYIIQRKG
ncbi:CotH kinase family protein [Oribacterium sp. WCC10]|uniref:CotH kinase family protein n=1 Tax=Oribacterium sp. WCC10 TaxID=1855343 RepID=UPI0008E01ED9|nr:CotH kinase family protein [Oribacterium sp. WCC10]SFG75134.1 CotH protein [Oribacterium sp. WCC10]